MILGILALCVLAGVFLFQWGAGKVAGEKLKEAERDKEAAVRIAEANAHAPAGKSAVIDRVSDASREL